MSQIQRFDGYKIYGYYKSGKKKFINPKIPKEREDMSRSEYIIENIDNGYRSRIEINKDILDQLS